MLIPLSLLSENVLDWAFNYEYNRGSGHYRVENGYADAIDQTIRFFLKHLPSNETLATLARIRAGFPVYNNTGNEWYLFSWCYEGDDLRLSLRPSALVLLDILAALNNTPRSPRTGVL